MSSYTEELVVAQLAVQRASILTKRVLSLLHIGTLSKSDSSPVTIADFAAQALIIAAIHAKFPADSFLGEENADALRADPVLLEAVWELVSTTHLDDSASEAQLATPASKEEMLEIIDMGKGDGGREGRVWMLDPVDGTATFLSGGQYAVALALVIDGKQTIGVLGCPNLDITTGKVSEDLVDKKGLGIMLSAIKSHGATMRPISKSALLPCKPIPYSTAGPASLADLNFVDWMGKTWEEKVHEIAKCLGASYPGAQIWSSHIRYTSLILGSADLYLRIPRKRGAFSYVWDHAGTQLIFEEAGGRICDLNGKEVDFGLGRKLIGSHGLVAARKEIFDEVFKVITDVLKED